LQEAVVPLDVHAEQTPAERENPGKQVEQVLAMVAQVAQLDVQATGAALMRTYPAFTAEHTEALVQVEHPVAHELQP
jgi:hypothetical protein